MGDDQLLDLWELLGSIEEDQAYQVLTHLFVRFEDRCKNDPADGPAALFFEQLALVIAQVQSCNVNRR